MHVPVEISFRNMEPSPEIEAEVREEAEKLDRYYDRITSCRVVVEAPHHHHREGNLYRVRIYLAVPEHDIAVQRDPAEDHAHEDLHVALRDAFHAARRQLEDVARKLRGQVKSHESPPHGKVKAIFPSAIDPEEGYGFIETSAGDEIYFDAHSLLNAKLTDLAEGTPVRFVVEEGEKGPQATSVHVEGRHHHLVD